MGSFFFSVHLHCAGHRHINYKSSLISAYIHQLDTSSKSYSTLYEATSLKRLSRQVSRTLRIALSPYVVERKDTE